MPEVAHDIEELIRRAQVGDDHARGKLLDRHRGQLRQMVALRLDRRLAARVDPSDIVQETLAEANLRLDRYLDDRPLPFYPWLRQIAIDRLIEQHRIHLHAQRRSVRREQGNLLAAAPIVQLADQLLASGLTPSEVVRQKEARQRVQCAFTALSEAEREVLTLRYLEQLPAREVGVILGVSESAAKKRALRALQRLRTLLESTES